MDIADVLERGRALFLRVWTHPVVVAVSVGVVQICTAVSTLVIGSFKGANKMPIWLIVGVLTAVVTFFGVWTFIDNIKDEVRAEEQRACTLRIGEIEKKINADADAKIKAALEAAEATSPTPEVPEEIAALCAKDAACRDRTP
ncbi:hypothetical protein [Aquamicrobium sp.]|uniref:hypothetical protein n=1 Tax=Aquamicrobium sp. TaxID=1872579 RepID=UPI00258445EF|nr:hypothetical protein [Aquamicrobium sp.]MCK9549145.1 hypothetical protein [Aquamicrobium sp.]